jgi:hypothetical protein
LGKEAAIQLADLNYSALSKTTNALKKWLKEYQSLKTEKECNLKILEGYDEKAASMLPESHNRFDSLLNILIEQIEDSYEEEEEEEQDEVEITGEYWIQEGNVEYADGDIGDINHEGIAIRHAGYEILNKIGANSDWMENTDFESCIIRFAKEEGEEDKLDDVGLSQYLSDKLEENGYNDDESREASKIARDIGDARDYAMKYHGWIWCRGNSIGLYKFDERSIKNLINGIQEILHIEDESEVYLDSNVNLGIGEGSTGKFYNMSLEELKERTRSTPVDRTITAKGYDVSNIEKPDIPKFYDGRTGD